jgi:hypothetical protein
LLCSIKASVRDVQTGSIIDEHVDVNGFFHIRSSFVGRVGLFLVFAFAFSSLTHLSLWEGARPHVKVSVISLQLTVRPFAISVWFFTFLLPVTIFPTIFAYITGALNGSPPSEDFISVFCCHFQALF